MRWFAVVLAALLTLPVPVVAAPQDAPKLNLVIVEGDGAINNVRQRTAREAIVQVEDENHKPVAGAAVVFLLPNQGASAVFADGSHTMTVISDSQGRAVARGMTPNHAQGQFQIHVSASFSGQTATAVITQTNAVGAAAGAGAAAATGISGKLIAVIVVVAAAAAGGGIYAATHSGSSASTTPSTLSASSVSITAGAGTVGPPR